MSIVEDIQQFRIKVEIQKPEKFVFLGLVWTTLLPIMRYSKVAIKVCALNVIIICIFGF